jgi:hypothetical protein
MYSFLNGRYCNRSSVRLYVPHFLPLLHLEGSVLAQDYVSPRTTTGVFDPMP